MTRSRGPYPPAADDADSAARRGRVGWCSGRTREAHRKMKRTIELKHVGPKAHVRNLLEELIGRLEDKLAHFPNDAVSLHVVFEENGTHQLYRTSLTCHVPGHTVAAHEERRDAGLSIREAFAEVERQLEKQKALLRREHLRRTSRRRQPSARFEGRETPREATTL